MSEMIYTATGWLTRIGLTLGKCVGLQHRQNLAAFPTQHRRGSALMFAGLRAAPLYVSLTTKPGVPRQTHVGRAVHSKGLRSKICIEVGTEELDGDSYNVHDGRVNVCFFRSVGNSS